MIEEDRNKQMVLKIFDLFREEKIFVADSCKIMTLGIMTLFRSHGDKKGYFEFLDSCKLQWEEDDKFIGERYEPVD